MRVERIEVNGFKSFADKTVFKLHPGTTAIVGPNGCGKSNIVDAFKWVLGEQSAKSLRGGNMADVIFAGSATKKTKGMAEVTLVLSDIVSKNDEKDEDASPAKDSESSSEIKKPSVIAVTRRLFRSGESEYLMNKVPCRLKDVRDMFLDTGLELKAYSILEQGRIGDIVNSKPQDRRFLIEEVAGVMKYKARKNEATTKLESSKRNLQRVHDIIAEVKRQINTIDRHAKKAEKYKKIFDELKSIDLRVSRRDYVQLSTDVSELTTSEESLKLKDAEIITRYHSAEAMHEEKKRLSVEQERKLAGLRERLYAFQRQTTEDEGKIALLKSDCENLRERMKALDRQDSELDMQKENALVNRREAGHSGTALQESLQEFERVLQEKKEAFAGSESEINELEQDLEESRRSLFLKAEEISNIRNEISHINLNIENINRKTAKSSQDINTIGDDITNLNTELQRAASELEQAKQELTAAGAAKEELIENLKNRKSTRASLEEALYRDRENLAAMNSKLESLREIDRSQMVSVDENVKTLCRIADILETPKEYETAVEAIMGDKLNAAVVEDIDEVKKALRLIKEQKTKRSGFITVSSTSPSGMKDFVERYSASVSGILGDALKFISVKEEFKGVANCILSDVVLVDTIDTAFLLMEKSAGEPTRPYIVTLEGDVVEPSGLVFGGSDRGVLKVKRQIKELEQSTGECSSRIAETERNINEVRDEISYFENEQISVNAMISSKEKYVHELEVRVANMGSEDERLKKKQEYISLEIHDDQKEIESFQKAFQEKEANVRILENDKFVIEEKIMVGQRLISEKKTSVESVRSELTDVKMQLTSVREKMASLVRETERLNSEIAGVERKKQEIVNERRRNDEGITNREQQIIDMEEALKTKIIQVSALQTEASEANDILEAKNAELALMEKKQKEHAAELEALRSQLNAVEMQKMEKSMKLKYLLEDIAKTYSIDLEVPMLRDDVLAEEEARLPELKNRIQAMGPVSLGALDEYEELKERYEFLTSQRDDLLDAISALEDTIQKINKTSKKRLEEAFEMLNAKFKIVFKQLFGDGRAELQLTEGSILDAGIEIIAQPPGKRLQNLTLLSGGEKALTALSVLFAGFMIKPTPICILDEVDAPLDESNTVRFTDLMIKLSKEIQFLTITHK
ncbi:chromosome segregation protein SMC [bacterium]|nr:chromosome segregation protein SMC [bacterium]